MSRRLFGTDGIRGLANEHPMTPETALKLGRAIAYYFRKIGGHHRVLIGKDTRLSGYMLETALASGICSMGANVLLVGPLPTPAIAFLTSSMRADAGVVISASHNPYPDNGIKVFSGDGFKLPDETEAELEALMESPELDNHRPTGDGVGKAFRIDDARGRYIVFLKQAFPKEFTLDGLRLVLDCAHGAAYRVAPAVFEELGAEVIKLGVDPDGLNINNRCGALYPEVVQAKVRETGADMGIALDGDADRVIVVDERGEIVDGDHIMAICAQAMARAGRLQKNTVVATIMSNMGLEVCLKKMGLRLLRTKVGDRYVVEAMREGGYNLGGEQSGHLIFLDYMTTGDGTLAALMLLAVMLKEGKSLSELAQIMETYPQVLINVRVSRRLPPEEIPGLMELKSQIERKLSNRGRIVIRPSGTEPVYRVMVEGEDQEEIKAYAKEISEHIKRTLA
ncbi:phosphoglucosamine mutase [Thermosulfuriphilus sp.]